MTPTYWAGLSLDRPRIMGILNVTPDSFSDGGLWNDPSRALDRALAMAADGADVIDVGGESTRPGADPVDPQEEIARVVPIIRALAQAGLLVSVDTRRTVVMAAALDAGARILNDVAALTDAGAVALAARSGASVCLMHMRGQPQTMQTEPHYVDVVTEVRDYLTLRAAVCRDAGIGPERIAIDPGVGFGKTPAHNLALLARLDLFLDLGASLLVGASRKSFVAALSRGEPPQQRLAGSLSAALAAVERGAGIVRVHDVAETAQALAVWRAIQAAAAAA